MNRANRCLNTRNTIITLVSEIKEEKGDMICGQKCERGGTLLGIEWKDVEIQSEKRRRF